MLARIAWLQTFAFLFIFVRWVKRLSSLITATQMRLTVAIAFGLAATSYFYLGVTTIQTAQVSTSINSTDSTIDDTIDVGSPANWQCADVPIAVQCGTAR
jgi:hypothetical protein